MKLRWAGHAARTKAAGHTDCWFASLFESEDRERKVRTVR